MGVFFIYFFIFFRFGGGGGGTARGSVVFICAAVATQETFLHPSLQSLNTTSVLAEKTKKRAN